MNDNGVTVIRLRAVAMRKLIYWSVSNLSDEQALHLQAKWTTVFDTQGVELWSGRLSVNNDPILTQTYLMTLKDLENSASILKATFMMFSFVFHPLYLGYMYSWSQNS